MPSDLKTVLVTGGAGYVGAVLVPKLLSRGYHVRVLDLYLYGEEPLGAIRGHPNLTEYKGDIRDTSTLLAALEGVDAVIHLACISNDRSVDLDPALSRSINYDAFRPLVTLCKEQGVRRFIFASSSSVYGLSRDDKVTEDHPLNPVTDYNRYKALCESILWEERSHDFTVVSVRPATVCGPSPRMRLDLVANIFTNQAVNLGRITVFGGSQMRPNIHIEDMTDLYLLLLETESAALSGRAFNAGCVNTRLTDLADLVSRVVSRELVRREKIPVEIVPSEDNRSYHISSEKLLRELGFSPKRTIEEAVREMAAAFRDGKFPNPLDDPRYYNAKLMKTAAIR